MQIADMAMMGNHILHVLDPPFRGATGYHQFTGGIHVRLAWCTTDLLESRPEVKRPPSPGRKGKSQQGKGTAGNGVSEGSMRQNLCT